MMKGRKSDLGIGIIVILAVFIMAISVLSRAFVLAKERSREAARLSDAVTLASNCADVFLACGDEEELYGILNEDGNVVKDGSLKVSYDDDLKPMKDGAFTVVISEKEEADFIEADIRVYYGEEEIYAIRTGKGANR